MPGTHRAEIPRLVGENQGRLSGGSDHSQRGPMRSIGVGQNKRMWEGVPRSRNRMCEGMEWEMPNGTVGLKNFYMARTQSTKRGLVSSVA